MLIEHRRDDATDMLFAVRKVDVVAHNAKGGGVQLVVLLEGAKSTLHLLWPLGSKNQRGMFARNAMAKPSFARHC